LDPYYRVKKLPLLATCNKDSEEGKGIELGAPCVLLGCPLGVERLSSPLRTKVFCFGGLIF